MEKATDFFFRIVTSVMVWGLWTIRKRKNVRRRLGSIHRSLIGFRPLHSNMIVSSQLIVRNGRGLSGLNVWRSPAYVTTEKSFSSDHLVMTF